jgi:hypothetical protein
VDGTGHVCERDLCNMCLRTREQRPVQCVAVEREPLPVAGRTCSPLDSDFRCVVFRATAPVLVTFGACPATLNTTTMGNAGGNISITGLFASASYSCNVSNTIVNATRVSATLVRCVAPAVSSVRYVSVAVRLGTVSFPAEPGILLYAGAQRRASRAWAG